jgi:hypothetical protein
MDNILSIENYLYEQKSTFSFNEEQIKESLQYLNSEDLEVLEAWYNTVLDFAALIPGVGSIAEGINLVSYAKQGEYLLAGLCAIGIIPIFGQYIGAGGVLLVKALRSGKSLGSSILKPLINLVAKFFPKITGFLKSPKFATKFPGIGSYIDNIIKSLKGFVTKGGSELKTLAANPAKIKSLKTTTRELKLGYKGATWLFGGKDKTQMTPEPIPVPKEAYMSHQGAPLKNIRPYTDTEISQASMVSNWDQYL